MGSLAELSRARLQLACSRQQSPVSVRWQAMEFRILGPLEASNDAGLLALGGPLPRALLAMLLLRANQPVPVTQLAGALWGEGAPASAGRTLQVYVSRLRKALGERDRL